MLFVADQAEFFGEKAIWEAYERDVYNHAQKEEYDVVENIVEQAKYVEEVTLECEAGHFVVVELAVVDAVSVIREVLIEGGVNLVDFELKNLEINAIFFD